MLTVPPWALRKSLKFGRSLCTELVRMDLDLLQGITWLEGGSESMVWKPVDSIVGHRLKHPINLHN